MKKRYLRGLGRDSDLDREDFSLAKFAITYHRGAEAAKFASSPQSRRFGRPSWQWYGADPPSYIGTFRHRENFSMWVPVHAFFVASMRAAMLFGILKSRRSLSKCAKAEKPR